MKCCRCGRPLEASQIAAFDKGLGQRVYCATCAFALDDEHCASMPGAPQQAKRPNETPERRPTK